jgi:hypothetical protein
MPAEVGLRLHSNQPAAKAKSPLGERSKEDNQRSDNRGKR